MDSNDWELYRQLERKMLTVENDIIKLAESNKNLDRLNGFILSALLMQLAIMFFKTLN